MRHTVIHFVDSDTFGGCEEVILMLLAGLDRECWQPALLYHDAPEGSRLLQDANRLGIPCRSVPRLARPTTAQTWRRFVGELRVAAPTIFHAHLNWPLACFHEVIAAKFSRVPIIVATAHLYSPISGMRHWGKQYLHAAAIDRYIAVSGEVKKRLCQTLRVPDSKIRVVRNGIRLSRFSQTADTAIRSTLTGGTDRPIIFTPARLHTQKGHTYLLEAARLLPDAVFVLAGDGPERERLEQLAQELGIEARVRFLGHRQDIPQLMASCDVFVLPSLYEGLPLTVLEAMAAGKPVVATAVGGTDEAVVHGVTGLLVPPANPTELAGAIRAMLTDRRLAVRLAESGRRRAIEEFSCETMVRGVTKVYDELIATKL